MPRQVAKAYSINRNSLNPLDLHLTSLAEGALQLATLPNQHWKSWRLHRHAEPATSLWPASSLVWLSPDAGEPLLSLEPECVYVIGGLVDRSVQRGATLERAQAEGAQARRLPLPEFASGGHQVLSLTSTVQILAAVHAGAEWTDAIRQSQVSGTWFNLHKSREAAKQAAREVRRAELVGADTDTRGPGCTHMG